MQPRERRIDRARRCDVPCPSQRDHARHRLRCDVGRHRHDALRTGENGRTRRGIVARENRERGCQLAEPLDASDIRHSFLERNDARYLGEPSDRLGLHINTRTTRYVVEHHRNRRRFGNGNVVTE